MSSPRGAHELPGDHHGGDHCTPSQVHPTPTPCLRELQPPHEPPPFWTAGPAGDRETAGARPQAAQAREAGAPGLCSGRPLVTTGTSPDFVSHPTKSLQPAETLPPAPRYVRACVNSPWPDAPQWLRMWKRGSSPETGTSRPHRCGSWRCPGCQGYRAAVDFARIRDALADVNPRDLCFMVLTLDRNGTYTGDGWADPWSAYASISDLTRRFIARLRYRFPDIENRWVAVVESHRSGWPHLNIVVASSRLARELRRSFAERAAHDLSHRECILLGGELLACATASGWGVQSTAEAARNVKHARGSIAGYMVKLARGDGGKTRRKAHAVVGELRKMTQVPDVAPTGFRRIRSGVGFLPPRRRSPEWTGALLARHGRNVWCSGRRPRPKPMPERMEDYGSAYAKWRTLVLRRHWDNAERERVRLRLGEIGQAVEAELRGTHSAPPQQPPEPSQCHPGRGSPRRPPSSWLATLAEAPPPVGLSEPETGAIGPP